MNLRHFAEYLVFQTLAFLIMLLPLSGARWLGSSLGAFVFDVLGYRRRVTLENLKRAFPEKSGDELRHIARGAFRNIGISLFELVWFPRMSADRLRSLVHFDRPDLVKEAFAEGKGVLMLTAHFGNWELLAQSIFVQFGFPVNVIVKTQANRLVDRSINKRRLRFGNKVIPMETSLREVLRALRDKEAVGLVADQAAPKENVPVEFFGTMVPTHQGPSVFSLKMGSPIIAIFSVRRNDGSYDMHVVRVPSADLDGYTEANATELTKRHVKITEDFIRRFPDQWMWMHKRWKHVPLHTPARERPMTETGNIVVIQTAFIGDAVLTLPLIQVVRKKYPGSKVDIVVTPRSKDLFVNHPDIREAIAFDKRGKDRGIRGLLRLAKHLQSRSYGMALLPHRSLRSAALVLLAGIPKRIGFSASAGRLLLTAAATYHKELHEVDRNLSLLEALSIGPVQRELPRLYPAEADKKKVDRLLIELEIGSPEKLVAIAPGTIWNTKRWPKERFASLAVNFDEAGLEVMLVGGKEDKGICSEIRSLSKSSLVHDASGALTLLQSAELIRRCRLLVSNDSAPMHLATAVGTPVVAIFGATVPAFGFGPTGPFDVVVETQGLKCRPCSIHGGEKCPIKTFDCMHDISHDRVFRNAMEILSRVTEVRGSFH